METPPNNRSQKRAQVSILFGLIWLIIGVTWLSTIWLLNGALEPMLPGSLSPAGIAIARILPIVEKTGLVLWVGSGLACVVTAFPEPKNPRSWQGKTAVFFAVLVLLCFLLPAISVVLWYSSPMW